MYDIAVKMFSESDQVRWDKFVSSCSEATFFHRAGWKNVIEQSLGHKAYYLFTEEHGEITGILPMGHINSLLFGNALISTPFCVYGGVAANNDRARNKLYDSAVELALKLNVDHLELRNLKNRFREWPTKELYVTFRKAIDSDPDNNMKAIPRKQRAMVRKGIKAGLKCEIDDNVNRFYEIYATSVRNHGTPVFSKKYFEILKKEFGEDCEISVVTHNGKEVSTVMTYYFKDEVLPYYGGGTTLARQLKGFDFMYWDIMRRASEKGISVFDYGRSKLGTGSYSFKKNWGFTPQPLNYEYHLVKAKNIPDINPLNPKYQLFISLWKRLPVSVTKLIGPSISKNLG